MIWIILIICAWFFQNCIHEGSHLLIGWIREGRKPLGFYPYPHRYGGRFYFARYTSGPASKTDYLGLRHIAPLLANSCFAAIGSILTPSLDLYVLPFMIAILIDSVFWLWGYFWGSEHCDGKKFKERVF